MVRFVATLVGCSLLLGAIATGWAQDEVPPQVRLIERYAAALSAGDVPGALATLTSDVVLEEHDLTRRIAIGTRAVQDRLWALVLDGAVLEIESTQVLDEGRVVVTAETMVLDEAPEAGVPLRSTGIYVIEGGLLASITRWLDPLDRDALVATALVGTWRGGDRGLVVRFDADGTFESGFSRAQVAEAPRDAGSYQLERSGSLGRAATRPSCASRATRGRITCASSTLTRSSGRCSARPVRSATWARGPGWSGCQRQSRRRP